MTVRGGDGVRGSVRVEEVRGDGVGVAVCVASCVRVAVNGGVLVSV